MARSVEERLAVIEEQNRVATPLHNQFGKDIAELKAGQVEIQTTLKLLVTNGHTKAWTERIKSYGVPATSGGGLIAVLMLILEKL